MEPCSMVRIIKQRYYWSSMHRDISRIIQDCEKCKEQSVVKKRAEIEAITSGNAWPFSHWGVNILGPLSTAPGGLKFLAVAIKHSTKWIEAKPLITVLWVHRTLPRNNQEEIPFSLTYGSEAIIPIVESIVAKDDRERTKEVTKRKESKEVASIEKAYYQNELQRYHSKRNRLSNYKVGDFVLLLQNNTENPQQKEQTFIVEMIVRNGSIYRRRHRIGDWSRGWSSSLRRAEGSAMNSSNQGKVAVAKSLLD
ncbi:reverse transcriptase domain-containing protein [Tanacetum coccineum]